MSATQTHLDYVSKVQSALSEDAGQKRVWYVSATQTHLDYVSEVPSVLCEDPVCSKRLIVVWRSPLQRSVE